MTDRPSPGGSADAASGEDWRPAPGSSTRAPVDFADVVPGLELPHWHLGVSERTAARLRRGLGDDLEDADASTGTLPVSPALAGNLCVGMFFRILPRNILHTAQSIVVLTPVHVGDTLDVRARVEAVGTRRGRAYVTIDGTVSVGDTVAWSIGAEAAVPNVDITRLEPLERDEIDPPEAGDVAAADRHVLALDEMAAFSGEGNFHSDRDIARKFGYDRPIAQGMHLAEFALDLLCRSGTGAWPAAGRVDLHFVGPAAEGDTIEYSVMRDPAVYLRVGVEGSPKPAVVGLYQDA